MNIRLHLSLSLFFVRMVGFYRTAHFERHSVTNSANNFLPNTPKDERRPLLLQSKLKSLLWQPPPPFPHFPPLPLMHSSFRRTPGDGRTTSIGSSYEGWRFTARDGRKLRLSSRRAPWCRSARTRKNISKRSPKRSRTGTTGRLPWMRKGKGLAGRAESE